MYTCHFLLPLLLLLRSAALLLSCHVCGRHPSSSSSSSWGRTAAAATATARRASSVSAPSQFFKYSPQFRSAYHIQFHPFHHGERSIFFRELPCAVLHKLLVLTPIRSSASAMPPSRKDFFSHRQPQLSPVFHPNL